MHFLCTFYLRKYANLSNISITLEFRMPKILLIDRDIFLENICRNFFHESSHTFDSVMEISSVAQKLSISPPPDLVMINLDFGMANIEPVWTLLRQTPQTHILCLSSHKETPPEFFHLLADPQVKALLIRPFPLYKLTELIEKLFPSETETTTSKTTEEANFWLGRTIGGCALETCLSTGNFSLVYKGQYRNRPAVIKILSNLGMQPKERLVRFQREIEVLYQFKHVNIIEVLATGLEQGVYYMIMPFFEGESLDKILQREQQLNLAESSYIIYQVAQGMAAIHTTQVIHRDLKPANILYSREQHLVKVIDFGLVREIGVNQAITRKGYILGTPYYMSPEQCEGRTLDIRTDIYSLGISFYQFLTGLVPFDKSSPVKTLLSHIRDPIIWPPEIQQKIPAFILAMIERMTAKKQQDRYQNMMEIVSELQNSQTILGWDFHSVTYPIPNSTHLQKQDNCC